MDNKTKISPYSAGVDLIFVLGTLFSLKWSLLQFDLMWTFAGPISLIASLCVATWRLRKNSETWKSLGLSHNTSHLNLILWTLGALVATIALGNIAEAMANSIIAESSNSNTGVQNVMANRFENIPGNFTVYAYGLVVAWVIGGFTEELLFRGFMINRFEKALNKFPFAVFFAVVFQALIFGQQHMYYQGVLGLVATGMIGLISGLIYLLCKRRLLPLIISHGLANTLGLTMLYLGQQ